MPVQQLPPARTADSVAVLAEAFFDYPVMRYVLGQAGDYSHRLHTLIGFFVAARVLRAEPVLGIVEDDRLAAVALVSLPGERPAPEALAQRREAVWQELGAAERARYEAFGQASHQFDLAEPHHHLNMIGVRPSHAGRGLARRLLDHVHDLADRDAGSCGTTLSTEAPRNVTLYERFGYQRRGHARVSPELETWSFFRPARA